MAAAASPSEPPPPTPLATTLTAPAIPRREIPLSTTPPSASTELRVLTWNVLADGLAQHGGWTHLPSPDAPALAWRERFPRLMAEVAASGADVVCLQECNRFSDAWLPAMRALGYEGRTWQKPRSPCERYGADKDGLALFWRRDRLRLAGGAGADNGAFYSGPYRHLAPSPAALATLEEDDGTAGEGGNAAAEGAAAAPAATTTTAPLQLEAASQGLIVAVFEDAAAAAEEAKTSSPPRRLVVAVTHLKAKEGFEARRREQAAQLCERVRGAVAAGGDDAAANAKTPTTAVLVAGDFNASPESAAAQLVRAPPSEGGLGLRCLWDVPLAAAAGRGAGVGGGDEDGSGGNGRTKSPPSSEGEELLFTTWKFRGEPAAGAREKLETIDHIFFGGAADVGGAGGDDGGKGPPEQQQQRPRPPLVPLSRWASPSRSEIGCAALPCESYPSDHIAVLCRFAWRR
jgi:endonuclease/exonuclease/phosphatase family metal-dependent hydrolase